MSRRGSGIGYAPATMELYHDIIELRQAEQRATAPRSCGRREPHVVMHDTSDAPDASCAHSAVDQRYAAELRARRGAAKPYWSRRSFCLLVLVSVVSTEFYPGQLAAGVPKIG